MIALIASLCMQLGTLECPELRYDILSGYDGVYGHTLETHKPVIVIQRGLGYTETRKAIHHEMAHHVCMETHSDPINDHSERFKGCLKAVEDARRIK